MKTFKISIVAVSLALMSFSVNPFLSKVADSVLVWKSESVDVGQIQQGTPKVIEFEFKNTSSKAVLITNVTPSCGCTVADYTKTPINPGKAGFVKATYNAAAAGSFSKTITVSTDNEVSRKVLTFKGTVLAKL